MTVRSHSSISTKFVVGALSVFSFADRAAAQNGTASARAVVSREAVLKLDETEFTPSTVGLCQRIERELISYGDIPDADRHQPQVILSCLRSSRCASEAMRNLSAEDLRKTEVAHKVASGDVRISWREVQNPAVYEAPLVREAFERLLAERKFDEIQPANVYPLLQRHYRSPALALKMKEYALAYIADRLANATVRVADADIPEGLFSGEEFVALVSPLVPVHPSVEHVRVLQYVNPSPEALTEVLQSRGIEPMVALRALRSENLVEPILSEVAILVRSRPAEAIRAALESGSDVILAHAEIRQSVLNAVAHDARVAPDLHKLFCASVDRVDARQAVARYLSSKDTVARVMREVRDDLAALTRYPKDIVQAPEIRHAALESINWMLLYKTSLAGGPEQLRLLVERYFDDLPDITSLIRSEDELEVCADLLGEIVLVNPRANQNLAPHMTSIPADYAAMLGKVVAALDALGINGIGRFHNAREIIINRYHAGTPDERKAIDAILGDEPLYTTGAYSLRSDPKADTRPLCVVTLCEPDADFNKVFNAKESFGGRDDLDQLTTAYKVVYFEPSGKDEAIHDVVRAATQLKRQVALLFLGGHGACDGMTISCGIRAVVNGQERIAREHKNELESLRSVLADGAKVPLLSCSIASATDGQPSFAQVLHDALPHVTVYGPDRDTNGRLLFDRTGGFKEIIFSNANRVAFLPYAESPVIEAGPSRRADQSSYVTGLMTENPLATAWVVGFSALFIASTYDYVRGVVRRLRLRWSSSLNDRSQSESA